MNNVSLTGRLTADPELKNTQSGISTVRFSIAVNRTYTKQGEERQADFINIVAWRQTAEFICKYFGKGQRIAYLLSLSQTKIKFGTFGSFACDIIISWKKGRGDRSTALCCVICTRPTM